MTDHGPFPGFGRLFDLDDPGASRPYRGKFTPHDATLALSRGEVRPQSTVRISHAMGADTPGDVIWTTSGDPLIVHSRVIDLLAANHFSGWTTYSVDVFSRGGDLVPGYLGLAITGRCGRVDLTRSKVVLREFPGGWIPHFLGHYFVPDTWDGSDLFMEATDSLGKTSARRFTSEPVHDVFKTAKVTNLHFTRLTEDCVATSNYSIGLKHLLPTDLEERISAAYDEAQVPRPPWV